MNMVRIIDKKGKNLIVQDQVKVLLYQNNLKILLNHVVKNNYLNLVLYHNFLKIKVLIKLLLYIKKKKSKSSLENKCKEFKDYNIIKKNP